MSSDDRAFLASDRVPLENPWLVSDRPPRRLTGPLVLHGWNLSETVECKVVDSRGERTLIARPSRTGGRRAEFDGDPGPAVLRTEALSGIRLTDGADWNLFVCTWDVWPKMLHASHATFADYYDRVYPGEIDRTVTAPSPSRHTEDFRSVHWYGSDYEFTPNQAACVRLLWKAWENGTPGLGDGYLLEKSGVGDKGRIRDVFKNHKAWKTMIGRGKYRDMLSLKPPTAQH